MALADPGARLLLIIDMFADKLTAVPAKTPIGKILRKDLRAEASRDLPR